MLCVGELLLFMLVIEFANGQPFAIEFAVAVEIAGIENIIGINPRPRAAFVNDFRPAASIHPWWKSNNQRR